MQDCNFCKNKGCMPEDGPCVICGEPIFDYKAYPPDSHEFIDEPVKEIEQTL